MRPRPAAFDFFFLMEIQIVSLLQFQPRIGHPVEIHIAFRAAPPGSELMELDKLAILFLLWF
ncbi:MAG: hypothetical protein NTY64_07025 [Deltaproteobacteria bacterium]|nr:hypothetical protein [Deltaproteobacteria bacterium]